MNKEKLKQYQPISYLHTLELKIPGLIPNDDVTEHIKTNSKISQKTGETMSTAIVNANKYVGAEIVNFSEFLKAFNSIIDSSAITDYKYNRVDIAINSYDESDYDKFLKLNNFIILLMSVKFNTKNNYRVSDLFIPRTHSIAIKSSSMQAEAYDKAKESDGKSKVTSRLELRKLRLAEAKEFTSIKDLYSYWCSVLDELQQYVEPLTEKINTELVNYFNEHKNDYPKKFLNINSYVIQNQDNIFSKRQLVNLYEQLGIKNPVKKATNFKQFYGVEYFDKRDLSTYIKILKTSLKSYFFS